MRHAWASRAGMVTLVGVMVLSAVLILMADSALADKGNKNDGSATDLSGVAQNWDKNLPSASRFTVLTAFGGAAVRDNNTGLVWEQSPDVTPDRWAQQVAVCLNKTVGGTTGWRLPSVVELNSVRDPSLPVPFLPASVFTNFVGTDYWSAEPQDSDSAWTVSFFSGNVGGFGKIAPIRAWCVRGPMNTAVH